MRKYGNISHYLANNSSLLSQNLSSRKNYDIAPTIHGQNQRKNTLGIQSNDKNMRRTNKNAIMPYDNSRRDWNQTHQQNFLFQNQRQFEGFEASRSMKSQRILNQRSRREERESGYHQRQKQILILPEWQRQIKNSIFKLKQIKQNLQRQIKEMQHILDGTSKSIQNMQKEFQIIKYRVLDYTSKCLDNAFINYRKKMPRWSKYEEVEKKGLQLVNQISDYIDKQTETMAQVSAQNLQLNYTTNLKQVYNRITHYNSMTQEIKKVVKQCILSHPTLHQSKIRKFQASLHDLCAF